MVQYELSRKRKIWLLTSSKIWLSKGIKTTGKFLIHFKGIKRFIIILNRDLDLKRKHIVLDKRNILTFRVSLNILAVQIKQSRLKSSKTTDSFF